MTQLQRSDLWSLEQYAERRREFRAEVIAHKKHRQLALGDHLTLYFEDRLTIQYQIQEMLRIEKIFEAASIEEELAAYNPLIPDGHNLKATCMVEYDDADERKANLARLVGIEDNIWLQVRDFDRVTAIADEDLERENEEKTSAVHFLRFEFTPEMTAAVRGGADILAGVDHPNYCITGFAIPATVRDSLAGDFS